MWQTIIKNDNAVYINGVSKTVDCSSLPSNFHALQWNANTKFGWIEIKDDDGIVYNQEINDISKYQIYFDEWAKPEIIPEPLIPNEKDNQNIASILLSETDWVNQPDVYDPSINPHLVNRDEFLNYRSIIRGYIVYPKSGNLIWPNKPKAVWSL